MRIALDDSGRGSSTSSISRWQNKACSIWVKYIIKSRMHQKVRLGKLKQNSQPRI